MIRDDHLWFLAQKEIFFIGGKFLVVKKFLKTAPILIGAVSGLMINDSD
jgi:hypothetical protein